MSRLTQAFRLSLALGSISTLGRLGRMVIVFGVTHGV
jgi:hypothetical protein